jgi:hypothetical protein
LLLSAVIVATPSNSNYNVSHFFDCPVVTCWRT